jgi:hypothetical protein
MAVHKLRLQRNAHIRKAALGGSLRYFEGYADRFGLTRHITFNTTVVHARREAGAWLRRMLTKELAPSGSRSGRAVTPSRSGQNGLKKWLAQQ